MVNILKKEIITNKITQRTLAVAVFVALTALGAFVRIPLPFTPVPLTLQTLFVLLSGAFLGSRLGPLSQTSYLLLGVLGVPVFTGAGTGSLYLAGPTTGYLVGFIAASLIVAVFVRRTKRSLIATFAVFSLASMVILGCGTLWLKLFLVKYSWKQLLLAGFLPFVPGDLLKAACATFVYRRINSPAASA